MSQMSQCGLRLGLGLVWVGVRVRFEPRIFALAFDLPTDQCCS